MSLEEEKEIELTLYQPHLAQWQIIDSKSRYKTIVCGRRFGKTTLAINEILYEALDSPGCDFWYVAPTYRQAKEIAWRMLKEAFFRMPENMRGQKNEAELWIETDQKARVSLKGADNEDSLRGSGISGMVIDEVDSMRHWDYLWGEVLSPSLRDKKGFAWFIGTPKGYKHLHKLSEVRDDEFSFFHFTSYDNPYLDKTEIDKEKERLTEDAFAQEYLADFRKFTGLVYKEFERGIHIVKTDDIPVSGQSYRAMDFGAVNPTVCLFVRVDQDDNFWVYDEYYQSEKTSDYHAGQIVSKHPQTLFVATFGDPSAAQEILNYAKWNVHITPANKQIIDPITGTLKTPAEQDWILYGIDMVRQRLKVNAVTKKPRLFISEKCINTINELEFYRWQETRSDGVVKDVPVKENDHCMDALRYFVVSWKKQVKRRIVRRPQIIVNPVTGY